MWKWNLKTESFSSQKKSGFSKEGRHERHSTRKFRNSSDEIVRNVSTGRPQDTSGPSRRAYAMLFVALVLAIAIIAVPFAISDNSNEAAIPTDGSVGSRFVVDYEETETGSGDYGIQFEVIKKATKAGDIQTANGEVSIRALSGFPTVLKIPLTVSYEFTDDDGTLELEYDVTTATGQSFDAAIGLTKFVVDDPNPSFSVVDGVLYDEDGETLIRYPINKSVTDDKYTIPMGTETIGDSAFYRCRNLETVIIPDTVSVIDLYAFSGASIQYIVITGNAVSVDVSAFEDCLSLEEISLPWDTIMLSSVFNESTNLKQVTITGSNATSGDRIAFENYLKDWSLPGLTTTAGSLEKVIVMDAPNLTLPEFTTVDNDVTGIRVTENMIRFTTNATGIVPGNGFFEDEEATDPMTGPLAGLDFIVFKGRFVQTEEFDINMKIEDVNGNDLNTSVSINSVEFSNSDEPLKAYKYSQVEFSANEIITLANGDMYVFVRWEMHSDNPVEYPILTDNPLVFDFREDADYRAVFAKVADQTEGEVSFVVNKLSYSITGFNTVQLVDCDASLEIANVPNTVDQWEKTFMVTTISPDAFDGAESLTEINVADDNPTFYSKEGVLFKKSGSNNVYELVRYPLGKNGTVHYDVPENTVIIGNSSFYYSLITSVTMTNVTTIRSYAFEGTGLKDVVLPATVVSIGRDAFKDCLDLTSMTIYASVETISTSAFTGSTNLTELTLMSSGDDDISDTMRSNLSVWALNGMDEYQIEILIIKTTEKLTLPEFIYKDGMVNAVIILETSNQILPGTNEFYLTLDSLSPIETADEMKDKVFTYFEETWVASYERDVTLNVSAWVLALEGDDRTEMEKGAGGKVLINGVGDFNYTNTAKVFSPAEVTVSAVADGPEVNGLSGYVFMYWMIGDEIVTYTDDEGKEWAVTDSEYTFTLEQSITGEAFEMVAVFAEVIHSDSAGYMDAGFMFEFGDFVYSMTASGDATIVEVVGAGDGSYNRTLLVPIQAVYEGLMKFNVVSIHAYAFDDLDELERIEVESGHPYYFSSVARGVLFRVQDNNQYYELVRHPEGSPYSNYNIPGDTVIIGNSAFYRCYGIQTVTIGSKVTTIAPYAFEECENLREIVIPDNVRSIGVDAFNGCLSLAKVSLPAAVTLTGTVFGGAPVREVTITATVGYTSSDVIEMSYNISSWRLSGMTATSNEFNVLTLDVKAEMELPLMAVLPGKSIFFTANTTNIIAGNNLFYETSESDEPLTGADLAGLSFTLMNNRWANAPVYSIRMSDNSFGLTIENYKGAIGLAELNIVLVAQPNYTVPDTIKVSVNGTALVLGTHFWYEVDDDGDELKGYLKVAASSVTGNITIEGSATASRFDVEFEGDGNVEWTNKGDGKATYNIPLEMTLKTTSPMFTIGYEDITIVIDGKTLTLNQWTFVSTDEATYISIRGQYITDTVHVRVETTTAEYTVSADTFNSYTEADDSGLVKAGDGEFDETASIRVQAGSRVTLTAKAADPVTDEYGTTYFMFIKWIDANGDTVSTSPTFETDAVEGNMSYTAVFVSSGMVFSAGEGWTYAIVGEYKVSVAYADFFNPMEPALEDADIPETTQFEGQTFAVVSIDDYAFNGSTVITVNIPKTVMSIGAVAFNNTENLLSITVDADNPNYRDIDGVLFTKDVAGGDTLMQYPAADAGAGYTIPDGIVEIAANAFRSSRNLVTVTIPSSVTTIGASAFANCESLSSVTIPSAVSIDAPLDEDWDPDAFEGTALQTLTVTHTGGTVSEQIGAAMVAWKLAGASFNTLKIEASADMEIPLIEGATGKVITFAPNSVSITGTSFYEFSDNVDPIAPNGLGGMTFTYHGTKWAGAATYTITVTGNNISRSDGSDNATDGVTKTITISTIANYRLPSLTDLTISVAGIGILTSGYDYDPETGTITIDGSRVVGAITITGDATPIPYTVNFEGTNATWANPSDNTVTVEDSLVVRFTVSANFNNPMSVSVTIGTNTGTPGEDYTYDRVDGTVTLLAGKVTGAVTVTVVATPDSYAVNFNVTDVTRTDDDPDRDAVRGQPYTITFKANDHFDLPASVTVRVNDAIMAAAGYEYSVNGDTATLLIRGTHTVGVIDVTGAATDTLYTVSIEISPEGSGMVEGSGSYVFGTQVTLNAYADDGYEFIGWSIDGENIINTDASYQITVDDDLEYIAVFNMVVPNVDVEDVFFNDSEEIDPEKLLNAIEDATVGINLVMHQSSMKEIPSEVFSDFGVLKDKVFTVTIYDDDDNIVSVWSFDTSNAPVDPVSGDMMDLSIAQGEYDSESDETLDKTVGALIAEEGKTENAIYLTFVPYGTFQYPAEVKYMVGTEYAGQTFTLYFYNPGDADNDASMELQNGQTNVTVDQDGFVRFTISHASTYVLVTNEDAPIIPGPADMTMIYILMGIVAIVAAIAIIVMAVRLPKGDEE